MNEVSMDYGGDVSPRECWTKLQSGSGTVIIDVRTRAEWAYVGLPSLDQGMVPIVGQEWQVFPEMTVDPDFAATLKRTLDEIGATTDTELCFLCRSGVRSLAAARAMTALGYSKTFNIVGGFEGDPDEYGHRGNRNGWKADGLPWRQG